jgi:hypothetical protein
MSVGGHKVPGAHLRLRVDAGEETVSFGVLQGNRAQAVSPVPREHAIDRPAAEAAVGVVQKDRPRHLRRLAQRRAQRPAANPVPGREDERGSSLGREEGYVGDEDAEAKEPDPDGVLDTEVQRNAG